MTRLEIAAEKVYPSIGHTGVDAIREQVKREMILINQFLEGLDTQLANEICRFKRFNTVEEALPYAEHCEQVLARMFKQTQADAQKHAIRANTVQPLPEVSDTKSESRPTQSLRKEERKNQPPQKKWKRIHSDIVYPQMKGRCYNCGSNEHIIRQCPTPRQEFCFACVTAGHCAKT